MLFVSLRRFESHHRFHALSAGRVLVVLGYGFHVWLCFSVSTRFALLCAEVERCEWCQSHLASQTITKA